MAGFIKMGTKLGTTYDPSADGLYSLIDDFYSSIAKSAGSVGYGLGSPNGEGYFNAIMGKQITAGIFSSDNIFTALGARAYDHEGVRIQYKQAFYGMASEFKYNGSSVFDTSGGDFFAGIGAGTNQDGIVPDSVYIPIDDFREPYKDLPFAYDIGLGIQQLENKDDTISFASYVDMMSTNYADAIDKTLLRPLADQMRNPNNPFVPSRSGLSGEASLQGIARAIANGKEIGQTYTDTLGNNVTITGAMVSPYGGLSGDFSAYRTDTDGDFSDGHADTGTHIENNIDGNVVDAAGTVLDIGMMRKLYRKCSVNWDDSANPNGKMWAMSNVAQDKLGALMEANNVLLNTVYAQRDFHGVKTIPGRDAGVLLNSFNNIPIIQDGNLNFDYANFKVSDAKMGDIFLLDLKHIWMSVLHPVQTFNNNNPAISRVLQDRNVITSRMELRVDKFIGQGRIVGLADDS